MASKLTAHFIVTSSDHAVACKIQNQYTKWILLK